MKIHFRTHYEMMDTPSKGIVFTEPSRTKQAFKDECDINAILRRAKATGVVDHVSQLQPVYADVSTFSDLADCYAKVEMAENSFMALPSELRAELGHDARNLVPYINNPANREKCISYGIFKKPELEYSARIVNDGVKE